MTYYYTDYGEISMASPTLREAQDMIDSRLRGEPALASYTGRDLIVHDAAGSVAARRPWRGCLAIRHMARLRDPITLSSWGFYGDWQ